MPRRPTSLQEAAGSWYEVAAEIALSAVRVREKALALTG